jgi:hypothetical protein
VAIEALDLVEEANVERKPIQHAYRIMRIGRRDQAIVR